MKIQNTFIILQTIEGSNTIWSVDRSDGTKETSFEDIAQEGTSHFESLFKADSRVNIDIHHQSGRPIP
jgi:hypothetical protein